MTKGEQDRSYRVMALALIEEKRIRRGGTDEMTNDEFIRRHREIFEICYGNHLQAKG